MTTLPLLKEISSPALVRGVGYALLHSLWQGGVLALLLAGALPLLRHQRAELRYAAATGALASLVLAVGLTFGFYYQQALAASGAYPTSPPVGYLAPLPTAPVAAAAPLPTAPAAPWAWRQATSQAFEAHLPLVVVVWLLGLLLMSGRLAGGLVYAGQLRRAGTQALGAEWQRRLAALVRRAGVRQPVALLESARVAGPLVLGHLRPVILLPLGAVAGLSPALVEALLAHELAHIVRRDYLLNLGLAVAEAVFFYHPAVWFMASCLRTERENCCDDQAAALCGGDRLRVARALAALAELEAAARPGPRLALAAAGAGGRGSLLARVRRLALGQPQALTLGEGLLAGSLALLGLLGLSTGVVLAASPAPTATPRQAAPVLASPADTSRRQASGPLPGSVPAVEAEASEKRSRQLEVAAEVPQAWGRQRPPRRGPASTVVIEKDKKGRVVNLTVDGQPVETSTGKKAKRSQPVRTVEVVQVPGQVDDFFRLDRLVQPTRSERQSVSFDFSTSDTDNRARKAARQGLAEALRNPNLNAEQRQEMEKELQKLDREGPKVTRLSNMLVVDDLHLDLNGVVANYPPHPSYRWERNKRGYVRLKLDKPDRYQGNAADARQADRDAEQADRAAEQADRDVEHLEAAGDRSESEARRAELRARIAAAQAELHVLDHPASRGPSVPRAPRLPRAPLAPAPPQGPVPPPPPPNTDQLGSELLQDELIKNKKHYSLELNDRGGMADGRPLTPAQVAKYRKLLNKPESQGDSSFGISVDVH